MREERPTSVSDAVESVLTTDELLRRPCRPPDHAAENRALMQLAASLAEAPEGMLQQLADSALLVCHADSSGLSFLEAGERGIQFRWAAIAGAWSKYAGQVVAGDNNPCGAVLARGRPMLFRSPASAFPVMDSFWPPAMEALVIPVSIDARVGGTVWVMSHGADRRFDAEDLRVLTTLSKFASVAYRIAEKMRVVEGMRAERTAALNLMEDAVAARGEMARAQAALQVSETNLRTLANAVPQLIWTNSADGAADYFNQRWYDYSGLRYEDSKGWGWQAIVHPDDLADSLARWARSLENREIFDMEFRLRSASGSYRWFIGRTVPLIDAGGRVTAWFGSATDIQDLKEAEELVREREEQFGRAIADAPIPIVMLAEDGEIWQVSRTWTELTGYSPAEIKSFDDWLAQSCPDGAQDFRDRLRGVFAGMVSRTQFEVRIQTRNGDLRDWMFTLSSPGRLRDGRKFAVGMALDFTERMLAERALRDSESRLREADLRKNQFLAMLGHELRNPLAAIRGGMALLLSEKTRDATRRATLPVVAQQVAHMERLVDDVLDVTRIVENRLQVHRERRVLQSALNDAIEMVRRTLDEGRFDLVTNFPPEPLVVSADGVRLTQIFVNLLNNAAKYSDTSRRIELSAEAVDGWARVTVRDSGQGIAADLLPRIFDPFVQAKPGTTLDGGLGLGLTVVRQLVALHDGRIEASSDGPGTGAQFVISLPLLEDPA